MPHQPISIKRGATEVECDDKAASGQGGKQPGGLAPFDLGGAAGAIGYFRQARGGAQAFEVAVNQRRLRAGAGAADRDQQGFSQFCRPNPRSTFFPGRTTRAPRP